MIASYKIPPGVLPFVALKGAARRHDVKRWRTVRRAAAAPVVGGMVLVAAWTAWRPEDMRGAIVAGVLAATSAALALLRTWSDAATDPATRLDAVPETIEAASADAIDTEAAEVVLRQAEKMETIGRCVGEFAHDFNNLLSVIIGNLDRAARSAVPGTKAFEQLADASLASERAAALVADILAFSRLQPAIARAVDIDLVLVAMRPLILSVANGCAIEFELGCGWLCRIEANQLENAILNLVVNARDAMPNGGRMTLKTSSASIEAGDSRNEYAVLMVSDTGVGMMPEVASRAFEPFFTTKPAGHGTGLGLSQIAGLARRAEGSAWIDSMPGLGTRVTLFLPRSAPEICQAACEGPPPPPCAEIPMPAQGSH